MAEKRFTPLAIKEMLSPFSDGMLERDQGQGPLNLPFVGKVGKRDKRRTSFWKVRPTGRRGDDLRLGRSYALDALRVARACEYPSTIMNILKDFPPKNQMTGIEEGFLEVIADCAMAGTMFLSQKSTL